MQSKTELSPGMKQIRKQQILQELKDRKQVEENLKVWRENPDIWLKERFNEDPKAVLWSMYKEYEGHDWDGDIDPLFSAWKSLAEGNWTAVESATGTGKTYILSRVVFWYLDVYPDSLVVTSAPKADQLKLHLWSEISRSFHKFKRIRPFAELLTLKLRVDARKVGGEGDENSWMATGFVAGIKANEESTTKAQGFHREHMLIITEETPGMPWPTLNAFINTSTGTKNLIFALGNPDNIVDPLHMFITTIPKVKAVRISGYDHPNVVLNKDVIPGAVSVKSIEMRREKYGEESGFFKSRVRGIAPEQSTDSVIRLNWIERCMVDSRVWKEKGIIKENNGWPALGVDVANSESGDMAALAWGKGNKLNGLKEFQCPNANHLAYNIAMDPIEMARKNYLDYGTIKMKDLKITPDFIAVDAVGVGAGTVNAFKDYPLNMKIFPVQGGQDETIIPKDEEEKPLYNFNSFRSQLWWIAAQDLMNGTVIIDIKDKKLAGELIKELIVPKYKMTGGTIAVEKKEDIKKRMGGKSPNLADAFIYWNYIRKGHHRTPSFMMPMR